MATNLKYESTKNEEILSREELIIKEQLESWITDVNKKAELELRLKKAFESDKSHVSSLSQM